MTRGRVFLSRIIQSNECAFGLCLRNNYSSGSTASPCHLDWRSYGPSAHQGDEKWVLFGNHTQWKRRPPLCHLDRSSEGAQWRDLRSSGPFPGTHTIQVIWARTSSALRARPRATEMNSLPVRMRCSPKRCAKMRWTAGTSDVPPVKKTRSTWRRPTPEVSRSESTHCSIVRRSSAIQLSKASRVTEMFKSMLPSRKWNPADSERDS